jgi:hypothetical protein
VTRVKVQWRALVCTTMKLCSFKSGELLDWFGFNNNSVPRSFIISIIIIQHFI